MYHFRPPNEFCWLLDQLSCHFTIRGGEVYFFVPALGLTEDMIAALGEATASPFFVDRLRDTMLSDPTGRRILFEKPRITSTTLDIDQLRQLPENTLGHEYSRWLDIEGVSPDTRAAVGPMMMTCELTIGSIYR